MAEDNLEKLDEVHPGLELSARIEELGLLDSFISDQTGLSRPLISQITNGNRRITTESAKKLCDVIGGDPMYWVKRQQRHDLWVKGQEVKGLGTREPTRAANY